jgi:transcriptional regulator with XRE-family HTH domain
MAIKLARKKNNLSQTELAERTLKTGNIFTKLKKKK